MPSGRFTTDAFRVVDSRATSKSAYARTGRRHAPDPRPRRAARARRQPLPAPPDPRFSPASEPLATSVRLPASRGPVIAGSTLVLNGLYHGAPARARPRCSRAAATTRPPPWPGGRIRGGGGGRDRKCRSARPGAEGHARDAPLPLVGESTRLPGAVVLLANVVTATQGETVRDEVLGSGDGTAYQTYPLKKSPLTYLPATDAQAAAAVESTLEVIVNGVLWEERAHAPLPARPGRRSSPRYRTTQGNTSVVFGDGEPTARGRRPSCDNIHGAVPQGAGHDGQRQRRGHGRAARRLAAWGRVGEQPAPRPGGANPAPARTRCGRPRRPPCALRRVRP